MATAKRRLASVPTSPSREPVPDLRDSVRAALADMSWLGASDVAMRTLALRQAEEIEGAVDRAREFEELSQQLVGDIDGYRRLQKLAAMCDVTKVVGWLGPQLQGVLRDLGGTPGGRQALGQAMKPIGGRLAQLRAAADATAAAGEHPA